MILVVRITGRRSADPDNKSETRQIVTFCDPMFPGQDYDTAPCAAGAAAENAAIAAAISRRKSVGLDYPGQQTTTAPVETITVTVA